jgi:type III pantothenate kinase
VRTGAEALVEATAALRRVELVVPRRVVGRNTSEAIQSGLTHGFASLVDGLVARIVEEQGLVDVPVVATGGLAEVVAPLCRTVTAIDDDLTLRGLRIVYERNAT